MFTFTTSPAAVLIQVITAIIVECLLHWSGTDRKYFPMAIIVE